MDAIKSIDEKGFDRKFFSFLLVINIIAALLLIPAANIISGKPALEPDRLPYIIPLQILWTLVVYSFIISAGINLSERFGYGEPILKALLHKEKYPDNIKAILLKSFLAGIAIGICLMVLLYIQRYLFPTGMEKPVNIPGPVYGLLASISAGISEETTFRFCFLLVFIWLGNFIIKDKYQKSADLLFWTANLFSGLLFGAAHISNLAAVSADMNPSSIGTVIFLNCIAGMSFGYMFLKYGLLSAMIAHFSTDIILHVIGPVIIR